MTSNTSPMISTQEDIANIFSLFHDGVISSHLSSKEGVLFIVEIPHLAQIINPAYTKFLVCLFGANTVQFQTWPSDADNSSTTLTALDEIFKLRLEILQGEVRGNTIEVSCNQTADAFPYGGGELQFQVEIATVSDEAGKFWPIGQLDALFKEYWDER